jgi:hypothetical protein
MPLPCGAVPKGTHQRGSPVGVLVVLGVAVLTPVAPSFCIPQSMKTTVT